MKKLLCTLLMTVLMLNLTACSSSEESLSDLLPNTFGGIEADEESEAIEASDIIEENDANVENNTSSGPDVYAEDGYGEGRLGSVMHTYFFDFTVNSAYLCGEYNGYTPAEGNVLLVADVTVKNTDNYSIEMYDTDFQIQWGEDADEDAYDYPITLYADPVSDDQLPGTYPLAVDEEVTGLLVYEVPAGYNDFSISYLELFDDDTEGDVYFVYFTAKEQSL